MTDEVDDAVGQWLAKANVDWTCVSILSAHPDGPRQAVCFHCQQYVEKLLKALLTRHQIEAPRTHDLRRLIQLVAPVASELGAFADRADLLSHAGVEIRYPDEWRVVSPDEMSVMIQLAKDFAAALLPLLKN